MEDQKKANRQAHLEATRTFNSLIVNMSKTSGIIYALAEAIENDEKHQDEDRARAVAFIDQQLEMIQHAKESIMKSEKKADLKAKKDA